MRRFIIEWDLLGIGGMSPAELSAAAAASNRALAELAPRVQWQQSYVARDKSFCVYLAEDEAAIARHAELSGFPATAVTEVRRVIDPTTEAV